jgi:exopolysaccharide production protein ExoZ
MEVIATLQVLRAIAATVVAYNHAHLFVGAINPNASWQVAFFHLNQWGAVGVDVFFVLSGVIITLSASRIANQRDAHVFLLKRLLRVVPYYWLLSTLLLVWTLSRPEQAPLVTLDVVESTYLFFPVNSVPIIECDDRFWFSIPRRLGQEGYNC